MERVWVEVLGPSVFHRLQSAQYGNYMYAMVHCLHAVYSRKFSGSEKNSVYYIDVCIFQLHVSLMLRHQLNSENVQLVFAT